MNVLAYAGRFAVAMGHAYRMGQWCAHKVESRRVSLGFRWQGTEPKFTVTLHDGDAVLHTADATSPDEAMQACAARIPQEPRARPF